MTSESTIATETEAAAPVLTPAPAAPPAELPWLGDAAVDAPAMTVNKMAASMNGTLWETAVIGDYLPILVFLCIAAVMATAMTLLPLVLLKQKPDTEKLSTYECGFEAHGDTRTQFDVRFYLVAILFIIFDLEVAFLFPWAVALDGIGLYGFWSMMLFLGVLTVGFIYEWKKGALDWE